MNLLLLEPREVDAEGCLALAPGDRRSQHIRNVLRAEPGDELRAGLICGPRGTATITAMYTDGAVAATFRAHPERAEPPLTDLVLAVPRPKVMARVLQTAATMGVRRIDLTNAWRVDKSYLHTQYVDPAILREHLLLGCEQGGATWLPDIGVHRMLMPLLRGPLAERVCAGQGGLAAPGRPRALIAHPRATANIEDAVPPGTSEPVVVAIGPEGGWIDRELTSFVELGFTPVRLGDRVLRVESAVCAVLAQLELLRRLGPRSPSS